MVKISDRMTKVRRAILDWRQGKSLSIHDVAGRVAEHGLSSARVELHPATLQEDS